MSRKNSSTDGQENQTSSTLMQKRLISALHEIGELKTQVERFSKGSKSHTGVESSTEFQCASNGNQTTNSLLIEELNALKYEHSKLMIETDS